MMRRLEGKKHIKIYFFFFLKKLSWDGLSAKRFIDIIWILTRTLKSDTIIIPHFIDEKIEAQKG